LKVFSYVSYVRVKDFRRNKLDPKARKCIFFGYGVEDMGYHFWDDQNRRSLEVKMLHLMKMQCTRTNLREILKLKRSQQRMKRQC